MGLNMKLLVALAMFGLAGLASAVPDAEADPWYGYGYRGYYGRPYGYRYGYYGKREAADEVSGPNPDANADADAHGVYGYRGYYRPYGYGGYYYGREMPMKPLLLVPILMLKPSLTMDI